MGQKPRAVDYIHAGQQSSDTSSLGHPFPTPERGLHDFMTLANHTLMTTHFSTSRSKLFIN